MNWMVDPQAPTTVEAMIMSLAGVCDGARMHDGQGFSGADTEFGHSLASRAQQGRAYTVKQATSALKLVRKYRRQLGGQAVVESFLQKPVFRMQPLDPMAARPTQSTSTSQPRTDRQLSSRGQVAVFRFRYDPELVSSIKGISGEYRGQRFWAKWDGVEREWSVPVNEASIMRIMEVAERWGFEIEERFRVYHAKVMDKVEESRVLLALNQGRHIMVVGDEILVAVDKPDVMTEIEQHLKEAE